MHAKEKSALVTGGAGFIGSHVAHLLIRKGFFVYILDNMSNGKPENLKTLEPGKYEFIKGSITNQELIHYLVPKVDYVFHLAAYVSVPGSFVDPLLNHQTNVTGTLNIYQACLKHGIKKIVFSSSCAVYQDLPLAEPRKKERSPLAPVSPYGFSKKFGEEYAELFSETMALPVIILRYFNVYGPRQDHKSPYAAAVPIFFQRMLNQEPITVYGDGTQTRDFVYVNDVAQANLWAALSKRRWGIYNVGTGNPTSINELIKLIFKVTRKKVPVKFAPPRGSEIKHIHADIQQIVHDLNFTPSLTLQEGLEQLYKCYGS